jgi:hypothetical protein
MNVPNFFQDFFPIFKNGQKKCPKMKIQKKSWKKFGKIV